MLMNKNTQAQTDTRRLRLGIGGVHAQHGGGGVECRVGFIFCRSRIKWDETNTMTNLP